VDAVTGGASPSASPSVPFVAPDTGPVRLADARAPIGPGSAPASDAPCPAAVDTGTTLP
jgi:hypothetical protein